MTPANGRAPQGDGKRNRKYTAHDMGLKPCQAMLKWRGKSSPGFRKNGKNLIPDDLSLINGWQQHPHCKPRQEQGQIGRLFRIQLKSN